MQNSEKEDMQKTNQQAFKLRKTKHCTHVTSTTQYRNPSITKAQTLNDCFKFYQDVK